MKLFLGYVDLDKEHGRKKIRGVVVDCGGGVWKGMFLLFLEVSS